MKKMSIWRPFLCPPIEFKTNFLGPFFSPQFELENEGSFDQSEVIFGLRSMHFGALSPVKSGLLSSEDGKCHNYRAKKCSKWPPKIAGGGAEGTPNDKCHLCMNIIPENNWYEGPFEEICPWLKWKRSKIPNILGFLRPLGRLLRHDTCVVMWNITDLLNLA